MNRFTSLIVRNREYRLLFLAYLVSILGNNFTFVAAIEVLQRGSLSSASKSLITSGFLACRLTPPILLAPFVGVLADRVSNKRRLLCLAGASLTAP